MKIRKTSKLFLNIVISVLLIVFAIVRFSTSSKQHEVGVEVFMSLLGVFGIVVKIILAYILPEIILSEKGIKFINREIFPWTKITEFKVSEKLSQIGLIIEKTNRKK